MRTGRLYFAAFHQKQQDFAWWKAAFPETDSIKDLRVKEHDLAEIFDPIIAHLGNEGISLSFPNAEDLKREQTRQDRNFTGV